jgi:hypothetical protein
MRLPVTVITAVMLLAAAQVLDADMCKWIDAEGTVHYAERCPEGVEGVTVKTEPPPSRKQIDDAGRRSAQALQQREARRMALESEKSSEILAKQAEHGLRHDTAAACETAFRTRELLGIDLPVYRDDQGRLHHRESLHHHWYEGDRSWLENGERTRLLQQVQQKISADCSGIDPSKVSYIYRFRDRPNLNEMLELLDEMQLPDGPEASEICPYARLMSNDLKTLHSGIPSSDERALALRVSERCR